MLLLSTGIAGSARAHDMWIEPSQFLVTEPGAVRVRLRVGHGDDVKDAKVTLSRIVCSEGSGPQGGAVTPIEVGAESSDPPITELSTPGTLTLSGHSSVASRRP